MKKQFKKINVLFFIVSIIHTCISFFTDKLIFDFNNINWLNYCVCKVIFFFATIILWQIIAHIFIYKNKSLQKYFKYFIIYIIPIIILLLLIWPGFWFSDDYNFLKLSIKAEYLYYLNYQTSIFYIIGFMFFPCPSGAIILQTLLFGITAAFLVKKTFDITNQSKLSYLMYTPFIMLQTLRYTFHANRPVMYGVIYLLLISILVFDKITKEKLTPKKTVILITLSTITAHWRSESIYLILVIPILVFVVYKINIKQAIKILLLCVVSYAMISIPQHINTRESRNLPIFITPLSTMVLEDLKGENLSEDLKVINVVLDIEELKAYSSCIDSFCVWRGNCIKSEKNINYNNFKKAYLNIIKNNPVPFIKSKICTFKNSTNLSIDIFSSMDIYSSNDDKISEFESTKVIFDYKLRKNILKIIEGKWTSENSPHIIYRIFNNLLIPLLAIALIFIYAILKKRIFELLLSGMMLGHTMIVFLTAPAAYFMYYFPIYLCGLFLLILYIIKKIIKEDKHEKTV